MDHPSNHTIDLAILRVKRIAIRMFQGSGLVGGLGNSLVGAWEGNMVDITGLVHMTLHPLISIQDVHALI